MKSKRRGLKGFRWSASYAAFVAMMVVQVSLGTVTKAYAIGRHDASITPESAYLEYAEMFPSVGFMFGYEDSVATDFASGVLIHPNFVLTSGHGVLTDIGNPNSFFDDYLFGLGANSSTQAVEFTFADEIFISPDYDGVERGVDLALLYFETPFTSAAPAEIYDGQVQEGDILSIVGYGQTGTPSTGAQPPDGVKRASQNIIEFTDSPANGYFEYFFTRPGFSNFMELGGQAMPGDSGGGWFIQSDDDFYLAGITSGGSPTARYGSLSSAYELNLAAVWIDDTIASVPEPSSMVLLGAAGLAMLRRRKRVVLGQENDE